MIKALHDAGKKGFQIFPPVVVFGCVYNVVRFQQDLIVQSINAGVGMVMAHQIGDSFPLLLR